MRSRSFTHVVPLGLSCRVTYQARVRLASGDLALGTPVWVGEGGAPR